MAVIHPHAAPVVRKHTSSVPNLMVGGNKADFRPRVVEKQEMPEYLTKGTLARDTSSTSIKKRQPMRTIDNRENKKPVMNSRLSVVKSKRDLL